MFIIDDFKQIEVVLRADGKIEVVNPTSFPIISSGRHGFVFNLLDGRCVKIFAKSRDALVEIKSYIKARGSEFLPKLYETGSNFIVMEYVDGINLKEYILENVHLSDRLVENLLQMFLEMERLGFCRMDESLRHIIVKQDQSIKIVDHFYAYVLNDTKPVKFFRQLQELGELKNFLKRTERLNHKLYIKWRVMLPEYFEKVKQS